MIGLDIGTTTVKFVQLKKHGKLTRLIGYGKVRIPDSTIVEGVISEPERLADLLVKTFKQPPWGKISAKRVVASLPEPRMFTRIIELPQLNNKDIKEAINYEVEESIPVPATDLYIDWQVINETDKKVTIFLAAAPKAIVNSYVQLFDLMKIEPLALEMSMAAIARSMVSSKGTPEPVIILDLGDMSSNIAILDTNIRVTETHPIGGGTIKDLLATALGVTKKEALFLIKKGIVGNDKAAGLIRAEIDKLITEINKVNEYYEEKGGQKVKKILLSGGLGFLPGLPEYLKKSGFEAKIGNPWVNISIYPIKPVPKEEVPSYACAIGLCLRGLSDD